MSDAKGAQQPVWNFAKFGVVMFAFGSYAIVDLIIAFVWFEIWAIAVASVQFVLLITIEVLLCVLYLKGTRKFIVATNLIVALMGIGALVNLVQAGVMLGQNTLGLSVNMAEAIALIVGAFAGMVAVLIHFIVQNTAGRSIEYKTIDMDQLDGEDGQPAILNPGDTGQDGDDRIE
jgi:uncharacterized membrane protein